MTVVAPDEAVASRYWVVPEIVALLDGSTTAVDGGTAISVIVPLPLLAFATQTCVPSDEMPKGSMPTPMVWTSEPSEAFKSLTVLLPRFATHTYLPSDEMLEGSLPTPMVWTTAPVAAFNS